MAEQILLSPITLEDFKKEFRQVINDAIETLKPKEEKFINSEETRSLFEPPISKPTLINWVKSGKIPSHRIGRRVYFKLSEVMSATQSLKKYGRK